MFATGVSTTGILTINTQAIADNWQLLSERVRQVKATNACAAVVKADAYGLGVLEVAPVLWSAGCREYFVASLDEAIELRECLGVEAKILVFGGLSHGCGKAWFEYQLIPVLIDLAHIALWRDYCQRYQQPLPCALKADTGMHRLGVPAEELMASLADKNQWGGLNLQYFISHMACADNPGHPLNLQQLNSFGRLNQRIKNFYPNVRCSLANSSSVFLGEDYYFDLPRPGIALYGGNPTPHKKNPMRAVVSLELPVMQTRTIQKGESVGYGATFIASRETQLATVFGGYADGLFRALSNNAFAYCGGERVKLVGRVSMDSLIFDISHLSGEPTSLAIINEHQTIDDLAKMAGTIGYEVLTSMGKRYQRRYIRE